MHHVSVRVFSCTLSEECYMYCNVMTSISTCMSLALARLCGECWLVPLRYYLSKILRAILSNLAMMYFLDIEEILSYLCIMNLACVACFDKFFCRRDHPHKCWLDTVANCTYHRLCRIVKYLPLASVATPTVNSNIILWTGDTSTRHQITTVRMHATSKPPRKNDSPTQLTSNTKDLPTQPSHMQTKPCM